MHGSPSFSLPIVQLAGNDGQDQAAGKCFLFAERATSSHGHIRRAIVVMRQPKRKASESELH